MAHPHHRRWRLPEEAQAACRALGDALASGAADRAHIRACQEALTALPASAIVAAEPEIRLLAKLCRHHAAGREIHLAQQLAAQPELGWLLIFHANGHLRQAALERLNAPPPSPLAFSAIIQRMNDWVPAIRKAAAAYAQAFFPRTRPQIIARSALYWLDQRLALARWGNEERAILDEALYRPDALDALYDEFLRPRSGRIGAALGQLLRRDDFDARLEGLAANAALPVVRAMASEALLQGRARWFAGYRHEWVDKRYGFRRRVARFETRPLSVEIDHMALLKRAARDKAAQIRKVAADYLIATRLEATPEMDALALALRADKAPSVASRADFYLGKRGIAPLAARPPAR